VPSWKKIIVSGSNAELNQLTATSYGGNISGSSTSTGSFGHLELANRDTDSSFEFGRAHIGYIGHSDMAGFSHVDNDSATSFALAQSAAGKTIVQAASGQPIAFKINNSDKVQISSAGNLGVGIETATEKLHVVGNVFATGNISGSATSTGSFGHIKTIDGITARGPFEFTTTSAANDTIFKTAGTSGKPLTLKNSNDSAIINFQTNGDVANILMSNNSKSNLLKLTADGLTETRGRVGSAHADGNLELYSNNGLNNLILSASMTTISGSGDTTLDVKGKLLGDGSGLTGIVTDLSSDTTPQLGGNLDLNSNNITGTGNIDILGTITAQNFIVSSSVTSIEYQSLSGSTIFGDSSDDIHQFTGSLNISGSTNTVTINTAGSDTVGLLLKGDVISKTPIIKFASDGGNVPSSELTVTNAGFQFNQNITSTGQLKGTSLKTHEIGTFSNHKDAIDIGEGLSAGMRWGYVEIYSNNSKTWSAGQAQLTVAPNSGSFEGIKIVGNEGQTADYLRIQSGSADILNITYNGSVSGSATSTGSFGKLLGDGSSLTGVSADVVDDTSPQLGGDLDLNSNDITGTGNINMVGTHQITGSLNISGSSNPLTVNSAGSNGIGLLLQGDVQSQTPLIKFASAGGNLPGGGTIGFITAGFQFTSTISTSGKFVTSGTGGTFDGSNQRGTAGTALFTATGNGGDGGGMYFGGGGAFDVRFSTTEKERLRIDTEGNGGGIQTSGSVNIGGIGATDAGLTVAGAVTIGGDLTVNGDTTTISTTNILVQDAFGFFATGSAGTNVDAGIIVQSGSFVDSGSALYHDISSERWSVGKGIASTATNVPDSKWGGFVATVYTASASPVGSSPKYGVGEIHVDDDGEIYIYS